MFDFKSTVMAHLNTIAEPEEMNRWLEPLNWFYEPSDGSLLLESPTPFHSRQARKYLHLLKAAASVFSCPLNKIEIKSRGGIKDELPKIILTIQDQPRHNGSALNPLDTAHRFHNFTISGSNRLAYTAVSTLLDDDSLLHRHARRGLLLISEGPWGKTHLLDALACLLWEQKKIFSWFDAARLDGAEAAAELSYLKEAVLIDNVHQLPPEAQSGLIQVFDANVPRGKLLVCTSPFPAHQLGGLSEPLRSRLGGGLSLKIEVPEYELLAKLAALYGSEFHLDFSDEDVAVLAKEAADDPRRLQGLVKTLAFIISRGGLSPAEALERVCLNSGKDKNRHLSVEDVVVSVAAAFGLKAGDLTGHSRLKQTAWPRRVAMYLARELTGLTTPELGAAFGGRDHSTIIHALKKINEELKNPSQLKMVENLRHSLITS